MTLAWVDGTPVSGGLIADRGLHYGDGLFETLHVRAGQARFLDLHIHRLREGCARLGIACQAAQAIQSGVERLPADGLDGTLKVIVTRGDARVRGYAPRGDEAARVISYWYPGPAPVARDAFAAVLLSQRWGENPQLAGMKHLNRLEQVFARSELAAREAADEGVVLSSSGLVCSGTQSNVFLWFGEALVTPRVDRCGIAGVMRAAVLREASRLGLPVQVSDVPAPALEQARAIFFTNARIGVQLASRLGDRELERPDALIGLAAAIEALDA